MVFQLFMVIMQFAFLNHKVFFILTIGIFKDQLICKYIWCLFNSAHFYITVLDCVCCLVDLFMYN